MTKELGQCVSWVLEKTWCLFRMAESSSSSSRSVSEDSWETISGSRSVSQDSSSRPVSQDSSSRSVSQDSSSRSVSQDSSARSFPLSENSNPRSLSEEDRHIYKVAFDEYADEDSFLDVNQFDQVLVSVGYTKYDAMDVIQKNYRGKKKTKVGFEEFCDILFEFHVTERELRTVFNLWDVRGDGRVDYVDLKFVMKDVLNQEISDEQAKDMIDAADLNGDEELDFSEFVNLYKARF